MPQVCRPFLKPVFDQAPTFTQTSGVNQENAASNFMTNSAQSTHQFNSNLPQQLLPSQSMRQFNSNFPQQLLLSQPTHQSSSNSAQQLLPLHGMPALESASRMISSNTRDESNQITSDQNFKGICIMDITFFLFFLLDYDPKTFKQFTTCWTQKFSSLAISRTC